MRSVSAFVYTARKAWFQAVMLQTRIILMTCAIIQN